jgi:hypothetical protein
LIREVRNDKPYNLSCRSDFPVPIGLWLDKSSPLLPTYAKASVDMSSEVIRSEALCEGLLNVEGG